MNNVIPFPRRKLNDLHVEHEPTPDGPILTVSDSTGVVLFRGQFSPEGADEFCDDFRDSVADSRAMALREAGQDG